jgi:hypothetical protein
MTPTETTEMGETALDRGCAQRIDVVAEYLRPQLRQTQQATASATEDATWIACGRKGTR